MLVLTWTCNPQEKQTGWWVVLTVPHMGSVVTKPIKITDLKDERTVRLVFYGPREPGTMQMAVFLRSDAYQGCDRLVEFRVSLVDPRPAVPHVLTAQFPFLAVPDQTRVSKAARRDRGRHQ